MKKITTFDAERKDIPIISNSITKNDLVGKPGRFVFYAFFPHKETGESKAFPCFLFSDNYYVLASYCHNAGKLLAFNGFEQCTAACGNIGHLVCHAELVDASH